MGNASSKKQKKPPKKALPPRLTAVQAIDAQLAAALVDKAAKGQVERMSFNRFMLRLPKLMGVALVRCQLVFDGLDEDGDGSLSLTELQSGCARLGYHLSEELVQHIFMSVHATASHALNLREFVGALMLVHVLKGPQDEEKVDPAVLQAFNAAVNAFLSFDTAHDGYISAEELRRALHEKGTSRLNLMQMNSSGAMESWASKLHQQMESKLHQQMDRGNDHRTSFLEFIFWLNKQNEDDEDDMMDEEEEEEGLRVC